MRSIPRVPVMLSSPGVPVICARPGCTARPAGRAEPPRRCTVRRRKESALSTETVPEPASATYTRVPSLDTAGWPGPRPVRTRSTRPPRRSTTAVTALPAAEPTNARLPLTLRATPPPRPRPSGKKRVIARVAVFRRARREPCLRAVFT